jgi:hypothetical protein
MARTAPEAKGSMTPTELENLKQKPDFRKRNPHLFCKPVMDDDDAHQIAKPGKPRLRQKTKGPNKLEAEWGKRLGSGGVDCVRHNAIAFRLANGVVYWPDWTGRVVGMPCAWEVKGFMRDDAAVKLKVAASLYPEVRWFLVWKEGKEWKEQEVLP